MDTVGVQERPGGDPWGFPWFAMPMQVSVFNFELNARNRRIQLKIENRDLHRIIAS
jgi:hypothetical protein